MTKQSKSRGLPLEEISDPRWQRVVGVLQWFGAAAPAEREREVAGRFQTFVTALEELAADPSLPAEERALARRELRKIDAMVRAHAADLLRAVARTANDPAAAPADRAEARSMLAEATRRLPPASARLQ